MNEMEHIITPPSGRRLGYQCSCGKKFTTAELANEHVLNQAFKPDEPTEEIKEEPVAPKKNEIKEVEQIASEQAPVKKDVAVVPDKQIVGVRKVQADVVKFTSGLLGKERAAEFATRVALIGRENNKILQVINKNPDTFLSAYMASVALDLMPNTPEQDAFIIPYGDKVQFQTGYRGLIKLARRSGEILSISAELVFEGDDFDVSYGTDRRITHKPDFNVNRTDYRKATHAYAVAKLTNGEIQFAVMTRDELNKIQNTAQAKSTDAPWKTWPERMALKTVLKRLTQLLPSDTAGDLRKAVAYDNLSEAGKLRFRDGEVIEGELVEVPQTAIDSINAAETKEEIENVLKGLPVDERKKAASVAQQRIKEIG